MIPHLRIEKRPVGRPLFGALAISASVLSALFVAGFLLLAAGVDPAAAYLEIFNEALGSTYGLSETLVKTTPLIITGLAVSLAFRMQIWNIGAEGQLYLGACGATWVALFSGLNAPLMLPAMFLAAFIAGGFWAAVAGALRARWQVNEVIVTLLMNYIAILLADFLVYGPWKNPDGFNFPLTAQFGAAARLSEYFNTRLHSGFFLALACALLFYLLMERTIWGFQVKAIGSNSAAARYAGMKTGTAIFLVLTLSGAIAGIAGALAAQVTQLVSLEVYSFALSAEAVVMLILGGAGRLWGAVIGTLVFMVIHHTAAAADPFNWLFVIGGLLLIVVYFVPAGLMGLPPAIRALFRGRA